MAFDLSGVREEIEKEDDQREQVIKVSRDVLKLSKSAIYSLHRNEIGKADTLIQRARGIVVDSLFPITEGYPNLRWGSLSNALEEWAEAIIFYYFIVHHRLPTLAELPLKINKEEYLGGLLDFTGELNRYAVLQATKRNVDKVIACHAVIEQLSGYTPFHYYSSHIALPLTLLF